MTAKSHPHVATDFYRVCAYRQMWLYLKTLKIVFGDSIQDCTLNRQCNKCILNGKLYTATDHKLERE